MQANYRFRFSDEQFIQTFRMLPVRAKVSDYREV